MLEELKARMYLDPEFFSHPSASLLKVRPELCCELPEEAITPDTPLWVLNTLLRIGRHYQKRAAAEVCSDSQVLKDTFDISLVNGYAKNPHSSLEILLQSKAKLTKEHPLFASWLEHCPVEDLPTAAIKNGYTPSQIAQIRGLSNQARKRLTKDYLKKFHPKTLCYIDTNLTSTQIAEIYQSAKDYRPPDQQKNILRGLAYKLNLSSHPQTPPEVLQDLIRDHYLANTIWALEAELRQKTPSKENIQAAIGAQYDKKTYHQWVAQHSRCPQLLNRLAIWGLDEVAFNPYTDQSTKLALLTKGSLLGTVEQMQTLYDSLSPESFEELLKYLPNPFRFKPEKAALAVCNNRYILKRTYEIAQKMRPSQELVELLLALKANPHCPTEELRLATLKAWQQTPCHAWVSKKVMLDYLEHYGEEAALLRVQQHTTFDTKELLRLIYPRLSPQNKERALQMFLAA